MQPPDDVPEKWQAPKDNDAPKKREAPKKKEAPKEEEAPKARDDGSWKPPQQQQETWQAPAAPNEDAPKEWQAPKKEDAPQEWQAPKEEEATPAPSSAPLTPAQKKIDKASERDDLPCDDGPYILDLCDCGEGLGGSFNYHKTALTYATALRAKYIDLPQLRGANIESAEPLPDNANVRRANAEAGAPAGVPPRPAGRDMVPPRPDLFDGHDKLYYSPFFGLGSKRCNAASLKAHRAAATGHLTFVDADQQQIEPTDRQSRASNVDWLCARMESAQIDEHGRSDPEGELFNTDPTLSNVAAALGGHTREKLGKLVLVFDYEFNHPDLGFCAISPEFRQRWRKVQHLEARPRSLKLTPVKDRVIAVHFRWGDTATTDVNNPNRVGHRTVPLRELATVANTVRRILGGAKVRVLLFTEASDEDRAQGRSDAEVVAEFDDFTKAVPNTELRLGSSVFTEGGAQDISTAQDVIDMAQADVLIGGSSAFFLLAAHLSEAAVFTSQPGESSWATAADAPHWAASWGEQPNVTKRVSRWGKHIGFVGFDSSGPEVVYDGAWWDEHGGDKYTDADADADPDADAGLCLPICYTHDTKEWSIKCHWMERCKDCKECTGDGHAIG